MNTTIGSEDVLAGEPPAEPEPLDPMDRTRFRRGTDLLVAALITVAAVVLGLVVWNNSEFKATSSQPNPNPVSTPDNPVVFPPSLGEAWRATSSATPVPVAVGPVVVTGEGGEVAGRDAITGDVLWRYSRALPLCTVAPAWSLAVAVYRTDGNLLPDGDLRAGGGCSEVTALNPASGKRGRQPVPGEPVQKPTDLQRHSDAELGTRLLFDGTYTTTTGRRLLTTWRSDLVQTMEYGQVPAIVNPGKQPRPDCSYGSVAVAPGRIGVIEHCPTDQGDRLTVYRATNSDNKADEPAVVFSVPVGSTGARLVAVSDTRAAVLLPGPSRLVLFDDQGTVQDTFQLNLPDSETGGDPDGQVVPTAKGPGAIYWFTGSRTIALHDHELRPLWTAVDTLGPGVAFAGRTLVPVRNGLRVLNQATGETVGTAQVDRGGYLGLVTMATIGPMVLEQRGADVVALR